MLHNKFKGMEHRVLCKHIFCPYTHPRTLWSGQSSDHFLSESSPFAYQINGNGAQSTMLDIICLYTPRPPVVGSKDQTFFYWKSSCCISNWREWNTAYHKNRYSVLTHTINPQMGSKCQNVVFFTKNGHDAYQVKGNIPSLHTPQPPEGVKKSKLSFCWRESWCISN